MTTLKADLCTHCLQEIPGDQTPHLFDGRVVCPACAPILNQRRSWNGSPAAAIAATSPQAAQEKTSFMGILESLFEAAVSVIRALIVAAMAMALIAAILSASSDRFNGEFSPGAEANSAATLVWLARFLLLAAVIIIGLLIWIGMSLAEIARKK